MATGFHRMSGDARRHPSSSSFNRSENRPPMNNVLCRNGPQCRKFQEGCSASSRLVHSTKVLGLTLCQAPVTTTMTLAQFRRTASTICQYHSQERVQPAEHLQSEEVTQCRLASLHTRLLSQERQCAASEDGHFPEGGWRRSFHSERVR